MTRARKENKLITKSQTLEIRKVHLLENLQHPQGLGEKAYIQHRRFS